MFDDSVFHATAEDRLVRIFLVGLIAGSFIGAIMGGLAAQGRLANG